MRWRCSARWVSCSSRSAGSRPWTPGHDRPLRGRGRPRGVPRDGRRPERGADCARASAQRAGSRRRRSLRMLVAAFLAWRRRWRVRGMGPDLGVAELFVGMVAKGFLPSRPAVRSPRGDGRLLVPVGVTPSPGPRCAVALVLVFFPAGPERRRWEWLAVAFAFVMALSRVYLRAHWLSDVVAGVLLGAGVALGVAATVSEIATTSSGDGGRSQARPGRGQSAMSGTPSSSRARTGCRQLRFRRHIT